MPKVSKKTIKLDKDAIKSLDVSHLAEQSLNANDCFTAGQSEYRLYNLGYPHNLITLPS